MPSTDSSITHRGSSAEKFRPNWPIIAFVVPTQLIGLLAWPLYVAYGGSVQWQEFAVFGLMLFFGLFGIGVGYHRGLAHRGHRMSSILKFFSLVGASSTAEASAVNWCADHRRHHRYEDTELDPYNISRGFWWAHIGWILGRKSTSDFSNCKDLLNDPMVRHQHKYYVWWLIFSCFGLPLAAGFLIGRPVETFLLAGFSRLLVMNQITYLINSYAHYFGRRPYSKKVTARDSLICSLLTNGEGWHNYHHRFPFDYRNGHRFYHWDPTKWMILFFAKLGMTRDLKAAPELQIFRARLETQRLEMNIDHPRISELIQLLEMTLKRLQQLRSEWWRLKKEIGSLRDSQAKQFRERLQEAREEFRRYYSEWKAILNNPQMLIAQ